jgi:hypothetical protein
LLDDVPAVGGHLLVVRRDHVVVADEGQRGVATAPSGDDVPAAALVAAGVVAFDRCVGPLAKPGLDGVPDLAFAVVTGDGHQLTGQVTDVAHIACWDARV